MKKSTPLFLIIEIFWGTVNAFVMFTAGVLIAGFLIYKFQTPTVKEIASFRPSETSIIYDRTGKEELYKIHGEENRKVITSEQIPRVVKVATVAAEDKDFYSHFGIDFVAILRALKINIEENGVYQGGSTITQQLARNVYLTREKTLKRKIMETFIAIKIERNFSKDQILSMYLNEVPYGSNAYGIESAAEIFFGKRASMLNLDEAIFLSSLPKAPTYYSPYGNHKERLKRRYNEVLERINNLGWADKEDISSAQKEDVFERVLPFKEEIKAPHFVFYVIENLEEKYGKDFLEKGGLKVMTTLDYNLQQIAEQSVADGVRKNLGRRATNASLVAIDPKTGEILAMVGSKDYFNKDIDGEVNVAIQPRQPGSSFKPIVYATAFERGYQPETLIADVSTNFGPDGGGVPYIPRNYDGKFHGVLPMRKTLAMSLNIPAIKTLSLVGIDNAINMAHRLGITTINDRKRYGLSLAIGGAEVKLLDMAAAFSVFASDGIKRDAHSIISITNGKEENHKEEIESRQVIDPQIARKINSILSDNSARSAIFGENNPLHIPGKNVAAKTGTTQEFRDAWTVGYTPEIAVGVWAGNNDSRPMVSGSDGVFVAAPIWRNFMDQFLNSHKNTTFTPYNSISGKESIALSPEDMKKIKGDDLNDEKDEKKHKKKS